MFDVKWIRENAAQFDEGLSRRGLPAVSERINDLDSRRRALQTEIQELLRRRNELSKEVGAAKSRGEEAGALIEEVARIKERVGALEEEERAKGQQLDALLAGLPNLPAEDVPDGKNEEANVVLRVYGKPPPFNFAPRQHFEIGEGLGLMDFERAAKLSGARFVVLTGALARLERALAAFMLDLHTREFGYTEVSPPILVRGAAAYGTGNLPKFEEDLFRTTNDYWLIPTAEMPLTNLAADEILEAESLPLRYTAYTPCFRAEAGAAGKDTRGMIRQHQFTKVELVSITHPDHSDAELGRMTACAEEVLKRLDLHYRVVMLCTGDMGFAARKTHDLEVWLPGQGAYREISSCSNCGEFQARRMKARFREPGGKGTRFVHTLNGSGLAVGRALVAVIENFQDADGSVVVPEAIRPYMDGIDRITGV